jgi:biopolymer transport protein TolQ
VICGALKGGGTIQLLALHLHLLYQGQLGTLLAQTGWVARVVLLILLFFSLFSWALIFQKWRLFSRLERQTTLFLRVFRAGKGLPEPKAVGSVGSPLESIYLAGHRELSSQISASTPHGRVKSLQAVTADMQLAAADEIRKIEKYMPWLATTGSVTPFIGLFGTVWGVMDAFSGLGEAGAASLRAVAPGIAEALITTAAGLATAIPAVVAYNHFLHHIKQFGARMDNFTMEVAALIEKQYL